MLSKGLEECSDGCACFCSSSGCLLFHWYFKGISSFSKPHNGDWRQVMKYVAESHSSFSIVTEFIRLYIFEALQMTHTCCTILRTIAHRKRHLMPIRWHSPQETKKIQEEDAYLRDVLEDLVPKLSTECEAFERGLSAFVDEVLDPEMQSVLARLEKEDEELYAAGRRELGVIMEKPVRSPIVQDEDEDDEADEDDEDDEDDGDESDT